MPNFAAESSKMGVEDLVSTPFSFPLSSSHSADLWKNS